MAGVLGGCTTRYRVSTGTGEEGPEEENSMIEKGTSYRPIDGDVVGQVEEVVDRAVHWRHKDTVFLIPYERFSEYFERVPGAESSGEAGDVTKEHPA